MKEVIITVKPDGTVQIEAGGYSGGECLSATKPFEEALGVVENRKMKPVFLQEGDGCNVVNKGKLRN